MSETTEAPVEGQELPPETPPVDQTPAPSPPETPLEGEKPAKVEEDWRERRIKQQAAKLAAAERERDAERARADELHRKLNPDAPNAMPQNQDDFERRVQQAVQERQFNEACNRTYSDGVSKYGDFQHAVNGFQLIGGASREMLEAITALDNGADVFYALGKNPREAERIAALSPVRMTVELAKMESKLTTTPSTPAPKPVSRAPAPVASLERGSTEGEVDLTDDSDENRWYAARKKQVEARAPVRGRR